jgi:hypothetical protein
MRHGVRMPNAAAIAFCALAFVLAALSDWFETRYVRSVRAWEAGDDSARDRAARSSVAMWLVGTIALVGVIEIGWFVLPFEALGLYVGTRLALRR